MKAPEDKNGEISDGCEITEVVCHKHSIPKPISAAQTKKLEDAKKQKAEDIKFPDKAKDRENNKKENCKNSRKRRKMYGELTISDVSSDDKSIDLDTINPEEVKEMTRRELAEVQSKLYK